MANSKNTRKGASNRGKRPVVRTQVTPGHLRRIIELEQEHTRLLNENRIVYPDPNDFDTLDLTTVQAHGFFGKVDLDLDALGLMHSARGRGKKKGKAQQGRGKTGLPNPQTVLAEVKKSIVGMKPVDKTGNIVEGEWNMEFLDATKAKYFLDTYKEVVPLQHILHCVEVGLGGLQVIANATGYSYYCSADNERGNQAVGFLVHPRIKVLGKPISYNEVANVQGIGNLRPAFRIDWEDTATGEKGSSIVVHMKSMRGGPKVTSPVRYQQSQKLAAAVGASFKGTIGGDWNTFLDNTNDLDPLKAIGFKLVAPKDKTATHAMGSRLDGFLYLNITGLGRLKVRNFWKNTQITRQLSDHGWLNMHRRVCNTGVGNDSTCGTVDSTGTGPFSDTPSDGIEVDTTK